MQALRHFYQRLGLAVFPFRAWLLLAGISSGALSILLLFADAGLSQRYLLPSLVVTLWLLFFLSLAHYAGAASPSPRARPWLQAVSWSLRNAWTCFLALMCLLVTLALFYMSLVALRIAFASA